MEEVKSKVIDILNKIRPFLIMDGGNVEFLKYEDGIVYIRMLGACAGCYMLDATLKDGIETAIVEEIPEVKGVINIE
jgi:Fe-S cluster biogenesis protein NfuA